MNEHIDQADPSMAVRRRKEAAEEHRGGEELNSRPDKVHEQPEITFLLFHSNEQNIFQFIKSSTIRYFSSSLPPAHSYRQRQCTRCRGGGGGGEEEEILSSLGDSK